MQIGEAVWHTLLIAAAVGRGASGDVAKVLADKNLAENGLPVSPWQVAARMDDLVADLARLA